MNRTSRHTRRSWACSANSSERYLAEGPKPELLRSLQTAASDWIKNHILSVDIKLKACIKK